MNDIEVEVDFLLKTPANSTIYVEARKIAAWLTTQQTRRPLIFDDDPTFTYWAKVSNSIDLEKVVEWGTFTVVFRCEPHTPVEVTP
jgi:predicted phage tail component-like protein